MLSPQPGRAVPVRPQQSACAASAHGVPQPVPSSTDTFNMPQTELRGEPLHPPGGHPSQREEGTAQMSKTEPNRSIRHLLAGIFALHCAVRITMAVMGVRANGGSWLIVGLALVAALQLLRTSGGRVAGLFCLGMLSLRMVWMLVDFGLPMHVGAPWLASYLATAFALVTHAGGGKPSARLFGPSLAFASGALAWTIYAYLSPLVAQLWSSVL